MGLTQHLAEDRTSRPETILLPPLSFDPRSHILYRMSLHLKTAMIQMIYAKSLRITSGVKSNMGVGSIVNLQSNDASKIWNMPLYLHIVWNGPFQVRESWCARVGFLPACVHAYACVCVRAFPAPS